jgi:hypothetical protein
MSETFKEPSKITKVHPNGTSLIRTKTSKHYHLVNTNLQVKYNEPKNTDNQEYKPNQSTF